MNFGLYISKVTAMGIQDDSSSLSLDTVSFTDGKELLLGAIESCSSVFDSLNSLSVPGGTVQTSEFEQKFEKFVHHHEAFKRKYEMLHKVVESLDGLTGKKECDKDVVEKLRTEKERLQMVSDG